MYDEETGLPSKMYSSGHLRKKEVFHMILECVVEDLKVSSREIARKTGLGARSINKYRKSDYFLKLLSGYTNKKMVSVRTLAIDRLMEMLSDRNLNPNTTAKFIAIALQHSEEIAKIAIAAHSKEQVDVSALLKELENM